MRISEGLALAFFCYLGGAVWLYRVPSPRRAQVTVGGAGMAAVIVGVARLNGSLVRDWAPAMYILAAYYLSGRMFVEPMPRVESWLLRWDRRLLGDPTTRFAAWPRALVGFLDIIYIFCFLLVPAGFAALAAAGRLDLADYYWTMVGGAELASFAPLPFLQTRPPWALERPSVKPDAAVERMSLSFLRQATTGANTLPSGHAAGSLAVALAVIGVLPWIGVLLLALALGIALATVVARAHYVVDVVTGLMLAVAIWVILSAAGV